MSRAAHIAGHIHVDHVGSLLRPMALRTERERRLGVHDADHNLGPHHDTALTAIEDDYVRQVVRLQEDCGLSIVTDGDFRRRSWWTDFYLSLTGTRISYNGKTPITMVNAAGESRNIAGVEINARVTWTGSPNIDAFRFLAGTTTRTPKVTLPGPPMLHFLRDSDFIPRVYPSLEAFSDDVVAAYRAEIAALAAAGCRFVQIDECMLPYLCDPRHRALSAQRGDDPDKLIDAYIRMIDQCFSQRPADMIAAIHMCRGNMNAFWGSEGGYEPIAERVFNQLGADLFLLEYDTDRAGDFLPLRHVPKDKQILIGAVSTKDPRLETSDDLNRRIEAAAQHMPLAQLGLCPQCGFSTNMFGTSFTEDDERRKLELMVSVSRDIWPA
jgi:5-methyltetrahydropteroyltriglutamate--homocysteine methyltransferase